jgi:hypothetical protein
MSHHSWLEYIRGFGYHDQTLEAVVSRHSNLPLELPADYSAVSEAIDWAIG